MFVTPYPTGFQRQAFTQRAHRLRAAVIATLIRDIASWVSLAAR